MINKKNLDNYLFEDIYKIDGENSDKIAINFKKENFTFKEVEKSVDFYANYLTNVGVKKGDHVALLATNSYNWIIAFYAIIKVGAIAVLVNYMARHETLVELIKHTDCSYLCYGRYNAFFKMENELEELLKATNIPHEHAFSILESDLNYKDILNSGEIASFSSPFSREEDSKRTSFIIFTTGTTAKPKAAMLSQYSMMNIIYINFARLDPIFPDKFMCLLPAFHCFGLLVINAYLAFYRTVYINGLYDKKEIYKDFVFNRCGDYASVSIVFDKLAKGPFWWLHRARFVKHCIVGGGFTSEQEFHFLEKKYGKSKFLNGYGQTECSPMISLVYPDAPKIKQKTTVGTLMEGIEVRFMDPATKELVPNGEKGEIVVKGYNVFNGYYKLDESSQPFDKDGWLHTGDLGYLDEDGYLTICGRLKDIIVRKGENISPGEIEAELEKIDIFKKARVLGFPSIDEGEYIIACVELTKKPLHFVEENYLKELHKTLPVIKIPSHIIYMKRFPLTANGKLDEMKLREICMKKLTLFLEDDLLAKQTIKLMEENKKRHGN